jgi:sulfate adenylyltransferase
VGVPAKPNPAYGHLVLTPRQTRALIAERHWEKALAFQTRNPLHRAHEYALVYGLEQLTRPGTTPAPCSTRSSASSRATT